MPEVDTSALFKPNADRAWHFPNGYVHISIDISLFTSEQWDKLFEAERLLRDLGITFDSGFGGGERDWEFDWSLSGANIKIQPLTCSHCDKEMRSGTAYWAVFRQYVEDDPTRYIRRKSFCCKRHRKQYLANLNSDFTLLMTDKGQAGFGRRTGLWRRIKRWWYRHFVPKQLEKLGTTAAEEEAGE